MTTTMQNTMRAVLTVCAMSLLAACASGPPTPEVDYKSDYNFLAVKKIAFFDESGMVTGNSPVPLSDMQRERIDTALARALENKGFQVLGPDEADQAQLLMSWTLITNDKTDVRTYETPSIGYGYGRYGGYNRYSMYNCWGCTQTEVSVRNYTEGTFIVDMIDPKLKRSVWRSLVQSRLKGQHDQDQANYDASAENILASFPPL